MGELSKRYMRYRFMHALHDSLDVDTSQLSNQLAQLKQLVDSAMPEELSSFRPISTRNALYVISAKRFAENLRTESDRIRHLSQVANQSAIIAPIVGGQRLADGILGLVAYDEYQRPPGVRNGAARANRVNLPGSVLAVSSGGISVATTGYSVFATQKYVNKLGKQHMLPDQQIQDRLNDLGACAINPRKVYTVHGIVHIPIELAVGQLMAKHASKPAIEPRSIRCYQSNSSELCIQPYI
jgi:hypothetical protein